MDKVVATSVIAVKAKCPACAIEQYFEVTDVWSGKKVRCSFCALPFVIVQSESEAFFDQL